MLVLPRISNNQQDDRVFEDFKLLEQSVPLENVVALLSYHQQQSLILFYWNNREVFENSLIMMAVPPSASVTLTSQCATIDFLGVEKPIYELDTRRYIFLDETDRNNVRELDDEKRLKFMHSMRNSLYNIVKVSMTEEEKKKKKKRRMTTDLACLEERSSKKERLEKWKDLHVQLALKEEALKNQDIIHEKEKEILRLQLQNKDTELSYLRLLVNNNNNNNNVLPREMPIGRSNVINAESMRLTDWLDDSLYAQNLVPKNRVGNFFKWDCLFENPLITGNMLEQGLFINNDTGYLELHVPLTYHYHLRKIISLILHHRLCKFRGRHYCGFGTR
jgi:hypothetical protein